MIFIISCITNWKLFGLTLYKFAIFLGKGMRKLIRVWLI